MRTNSVKIQLAGFLRNEIQEWAPDLIVVAERKGTALFRALLEDPECEISWPWDKIISSSAIEQLPPGSLDRKRLLVFDDMIRSGQHIRLVISELQNAGVQADNSNVRFSFFAAHRDASGAGFLDAGPRRSRGWFHRDLEDRAYGSIRSELVKMLQASGSLMLDTEHIEVRLKLNSGFTVSELLKFLRRSADACVFKSLGGRTNITLFYGDDDSHKLPDPRFPKGIGYTEIVKKCRLVERAANEFAVIPICLPSLPMISGEGTTEPWVPQRRDSLILGSGWKASVVAQFYAVALIGSLYPLRWIIKDLFAGDPSLFTLPLPHAGEGGGAGYSLAHLRVMYPTLNVQELVKEIRSTVQSSASDGRKLKGRRRAKGKLPTSWSDREAQRDAFQLLQMIVHESDRRFCESEVFKVSNVRGLRASEIFRLGRMLGWEAPKISTLFDILIDNAELVTRVEQYCDRQGSGRIARTFRPDGEVVSGNVRRRTAQWGLPHDFLG